MLYLIRAQGHPPEVGDHHPTDQRADRIEENLLNPPRDMFRPGLFLLNNVLKHKDGDSECPKEYSRYNSRHKKPTEVSKELSHSSSLSPLTPSLCSADSFAKISTRISTAGKTYLLSRLEPRCETARGSERSEVPQPDDPLRHL